MTEFIILSRVDISTLCHDEAVTVYIDEKPYVICTDEYFENWKRQKVRTNDMGYRPTIICENERHEFGKFYGYIGITEELKSIKWLQENNKIDEPEIYCWSGFGPQISFSAEEFREFIDLYEQDINNYDFSNINNYITYPKPYKLSDSWNKFKEIYDNDKPKIIEWG